MVRTTNKKSQRNKRKQLQVESTKTAKKLRQDVFENLARKMIEQQTHNKENNIARKDSYGVFQKVFNEKKAVMDWLTKDKGSHLARFGSSTVVVWMKMS